MKTNLSWAFIGIIAAGLAQLDIPAARADSASISLAGQWRFALDRADAGIREQWFDRKLAWQIKLPGCLTERGIGDPITLSTPWLAQVQDPNWAQNPIYAPYTRPDNFKFPFWLQPEKYYAGPAWFQREIVIPKDWVNQRVVLTLERAHWETRVWIDDRLVGTNDSLSTPHEYDLGVLAPGKHALTIRVDNRLVVDVGINSHSVCDHTQGNWNGLVGRIELTARPPVCIADLQVFPNVAARSARVRLQTLNVTGKPAQGTLSLVVEPAHGAAVSKEFSSAQPKNIIEVDVALGPDAKTWDEFSPALYRVRAELRGQVAGQAFEHRRTVAFGLREISTEGTQFLINGRPVFFRGTLECAIFPKTGYPPTDVDSWKRIIRTCQSFGLNLIRFHSWCPPEAAFSAADELGFYYHVECASWPNQSTTLGDEKPVDAWLYREMERILRAYGNHPSFVLTPCGNEPGGRNANAYLAQWVNHWKAADPRRLYTSGAGWPQIPENQFHVTPDPRIQGWGQGLKSRINARPPETRTDYRDYVAARRVPVISHEIGQWCVYPNFEEMRKYTGYLKPRNFEIFRDSLGRHHLGDLARRFLLASGKLQTLCYKEDIESALRTPGMGGFQLLDLHDFPGQGTALVGVLDPFWEEKGYVTAAQYRRFCNATVPLARLGKRVFTTDETLEAGLEVSHFGREPLTGAVVYWKLASGAGRVLARGELLATTIPIGNGTGVGTVRFPLEEVPAPAQYRLVAGLRGTPFENDWDVWVFPRQLAENPASSVKIAKDLDQSALSTLEAGGRVLLLIPHAADKPAAQRRVALGFSSLFWNTAWTHGQPPHTLGILCDPAHPLFRDFPTEYYSNWQWWYLVSRAHAMVLDGLPAELRPQVGVIDDWVTNRRLGLYFEAALGRGKLAVCSIDLDPERDPNPVVRQFRYSLLRYLESRRFQPKTSVTAEQIRALIADAQ